ncbi:fibronectin type III domain-containing protein [Pseudaminobacter salicylatoxidans]|nr:fibronectin type III domain-containing protein [Pseudaminobacter salicylatoxidans]
MSTSWMRRRASLYGFNQCLEDTTALNYPNRYKTGFIEGIILLGLTSAGVTGAALGIATTLLTYGTVIGLSIGLNFLASSIFSPPQPKPEDMQQSSKQPLQPRVRHYGRVKVSGAWVFAEATAATFHKVLALGVGPIDAFEEFWIEDTKVALGSGGWVQTDPWGGSGDARILSRRGLAAETYYSELGSTFPEWTTAHRGDGTASLYAYQGSATQENYMKRWPNGINTNFRVVMRAAQVMNPVTGATAWNDNAAAVIRDYVTHSDGMRLPAVIVSTPLAQAGWVAAYNRCQEAIGRKGGGTEPRYRLWGSYRLDERPADVLGRMLACCDGRLVPTPDGGLTLDIGGPDEATVVIGPDTITGFSELGRGRDVLSTANTIRATFLDPASDYQAADADAWVDAADVTDRGEIATDKQFNMAPSHSQARRLMKLEAYRANPKWVGTFQCNLRGLAAFGKRYVRIQYPLFQIDERFEIQDFKFVVGEGNILTGVTISVQSMPVAANQWSAAQEEGDAPASDHSQGSGIPTPAKPIVDMIEGPKASIPLAPPPGPAFDYEARYKKSSGSTWSVIKNIAHDATVVETPVLDDGTSYDFALRYITSGAGFIGDWSSTTTASTPV